MIATLIALSEGTALFLFSAGLGLRFWAFASGGLEFPGSVSVCQGSGCLGFRA